MEEDVGTHHGLPCRVKWGLLSHFALALWVAFILCSCGDNGDDGTGPNGPEPSFRAVNYSVPTVCAEEDNVNVPVLGQATAFDIFASHPTYAYTESDCTPDFSNCEPSGPVYSFDPATVELFNDGTLIVEAVREAEYWRPQGMHVSVVGSPEFAENATFVRLYLKIEDAAEWPQILVIYADGNVRLIPHPPEGFPSVCFGTSVIVGPAQPAPRPLAEIESVSFDPSNRQFLADYRAGGSSKISVQSVSRAAIRVEVQVQYGELDQPLAVFRSMFVAEDNADATRIRWYHREAEKGDRGIMDFEEAAGDRWCLYRRVYSVHNNTASDVCVAVSNAADAS